MAVAFMGKMLALYKACCKESSDPDPAEFFCVDFK